MLWSRAAADPPSPVITARLPAENPGPQLQRLVSCQLDDPRTILLSNRNELRGYRAGNKKDDNRRLHSQA